MRALRLFLLATFPALTSVVLVTFGFLSQQADETRSSLYLVPFWVSQLVIFIFFSERTWLYILLISGLSVSILLWPLSSGSFANGVMVALLALGGATLGALEAARLFLLLYEIKIIKNSAQNAALVLVITNALNLFFVYAVLVMQHSYFTSFAFIFMVISFLLTSSTSDPVRIKSQDCSGNHIIGRLRGTKSAIIVALAILCITLANIEIGREGSVSPYRAVFLDGAFLFGAIGAWVSATWPPRYMFAVSSIALAILLVSFFQILPIAIGGFVAIGWGTSRVIAINIAHIAISEDVQTWRIYGILIITSQIIFYAFLQGIAVDTIDLASLVYLLVAALVLTKILWPSLRAIAWGVSH